MGTNVKPGILTLKKHSAKALAALVAAVCTAAVGLGFLAYFEYTDKYSPGWHTDQSGTYYILRTSGERATGLKLINNSSYLFAEDGVMLTGWQEYEGNTYYFDKSGVMQKGIVEIDGEEYYLSDESGIFKTGLQDFNGEQFYFNDHGIPDKGFNKDGDYYYDEAGRRISGWAEINGIQYYFFESGKNEGKMAKGWTDIADENGDVYTYYFGIDGHMFTGINNIQGSVYDFQETGHLFKGWRNDGKYFVHADEETGEFDLGFTEIDGKIYYFDENYHMTTGWAKNGEYSYHFNRDGTMTLGWLEENLRKYYFCDDGTAASGFIKVGLEYYYFDPENHQLQTGWQRIDGDLYNFGEDGKVAQGFFKYKDYYYFFDQTTHKAAKGLTKTVAYTGAEKKAIKKFKSDMEELGEFLEVKKEYKIPDYPYDRLDESESDYDTKLYNLNNAKQKFRKAVKAAGYSEKEAERVEELYKNYVCVNYYGAMETAAYRKLGESLFGQHFFGDDNVLKTGWQTVEGYKFYFDPVSGEKITGWKNILGKRYYFGDLGVCAMGKVNIDGKDYDFGTDGALPSGVVKVGDKLKYVIDDNNHYGKNTFGRDGNRIYYFDKDGNAVKGWKDIEGRTYFFGDDYVLKTGFQKRGEDRLFISDTGALKDSWLNIDGSTYYFDGDGRAVNGWKEIGGVSFYFSDYRLRQGWTTIDDKHYYFENGVPKRGLFYDDSKLRVIGEEGYLKEGWVMWEGNMFYNDSKGTPITDTSRRIGEELYFFDSNGVATLLK